MDSLSKLIERILEKKSALVAVVIVIMAFTGALVLFNNYSSKMSDYRGQIRQMREKTEAIDQRDKSVEELNRFFASSTQGRKTETLIHQLTECAGDNEVEIFDMTPEKMIKEKNNISTEVDLRVNSKNFKNLILFLKTIESPPYSLRVEYWSGKLKSPESEAVTCEINVASLQIKK